MFYIFHKMQSLRNLSIILLLLVLGNILLHGQPGPSEVKQVHLSSMPSFESAKVPRYTDCEHLQVINYTAPGAVNTARTQARFFFLNIHSDFLFGRIVNNFSSRENVLSSLIQNTITFHEPPCNLYVFALRKIII